MNFEDLQAAHRHFAGACFNQAWELIDKPERTAVEEEQMLALTMTSFWHWTQREDYDALKASVAYWQISRVFALLNQPENARRYGRRSLEVLPEDAPPFYRGYALEALARAEAVAGSRIAMQAHLKDARHLAEQIGDADSKSWLTADLETIPLLLPAAKSEPLKR